MEKLAKTVQQPIGIFDSGVGGLTVANAINKYLPNEQLIYFGDTAHLPYGDKAANSIKHYTEKISEFLLEKGCKMIVNACNTASSIAYEEFRKIAAGNALTVNVIDPVVEVVSQHPNINNVGVIGTKGTIRSNVYEDKLLARNDQLKVTSLATPLLVPIIEEMHTNTAISKAVIDKYLSEKSFQELDVLILGCTHYPLIKDEIEAYYNGNTTIIDSADIVGKFVHDLVQREGLMNQAPLNIQHHFYVSDYTNSFEQNAHAFFGKEIHLEQLNIWS